MKIAVLNNHVPFVSGGAEYLADALVTQLQAAGHEAVLYRLPFQWTPPERVVEHLLACRLLRLVGVDRVIALKFPVYCVPHDNKVLWLLHQFRQAYDFWGTPWQDLPDTPQGHAIRQAVINADNHYLPEARAIYTNSHVTGDRLRRFNHLESTVLYPPLLNPGQFHCSAYGDYLFYPSRLTRSKRQLLVVEALRHTRTPVKLVIAGGAEQPDALAEIEAVIASHRLEDRVTIIPRFISEAEKVEWMAGALGCTYTPIDEDSYGYVTLEAYEARKPVISCLDSGGVSIVVRHDETGFLVAPEPEALATAMDALYADRQRARALGEAGFAHVRSLGLTWTRVVETLTA
jgi:glycosyltransferase involved in cell wall biosynthesis